MENSCRYFENTACEYYPCHQREHLNCLFCYCPLYRLADCPGNPRYIEKNGKRIKVCTDCTFPHEEKNYDRILEILKGADQNGPEVK